MRSPKLIYKNVNDTTADLVAAYKLKGGKVTKCKTVGTRIEPKTLSPFDTHVSR